MKKYHILFPALVLLFFSCTKVVEFEGEITEPRLVVNSILNPDSVFRVSVSRSRFFLDDAPVENIENAIVKLYSEGTLLGTLPHTSEGIYEDPGIIPNADKEYSIQVEAPDFKNVSSTANIPTPIPISSLDTLTTFYDNYLENLEVKLEIQDPANEENFYRISCFAEAWYWDQVAGEFYYDKRNMWIWSDDPVIAGTEGENEIFDTGAYNEFNIFNDNLFNGKSYHVKFNISPWDLMSDTEESHYKLHFYLETLSEDYFKYLKTRTEHNANDGNPFSEPVPVFSNIENGIGFFGGYSAASYSVDHDGYNDPWRK